MTSSQSSGAPDSVVRAANPPGALFGALLLGVPLAAFLLYLIHFGPVRETFLYRYFSHPIEVAGPADWRSEVLRGFVAVPVKRPLHPAALSFRSRPVRSRPSRPDDDSRDAAETRGRPAGHRPVTWGDGHHLKEWSRGGPTTIANGAIPCAAHHVLLHEGGWTLQRLPDGAYIIRHRTGKIIGPEPYPPGHNRPPPHPRT